MNCKDDFPNYNCVFWIQGNDSQANPFPWPLALSNLMGSFPAEKPQQSKNAWASSWVGKSLQSRSGPEHGYLHEPSLGGGNIVVGSDVAPSGLVVGVTSQTPLHNPFLWLLFELPKIFPDTSHQAGKWKIGHSLL